MSKHAGGMVILVEIDQTSLSAAYDLGLHCLLSQACLTKYGMLYFISEFYGQRELTKWKRGDRQ